MSGRGRQDRSSGWGPPARAALRKDKTNFEERRRVARQRDPRKRQDEEDVRVVANVEDEVVPAVDGTDEELERRGGKTSQR